MKRINKTIGAIGTGLLAVMIFGMSSECNAGTAAVAAFSSNYFGGRFDPLTSAAGIDNLTFTVGSGMTCQWYYDSVNLGNFSTSPDMATAFAANSYIEFSFDTAAGKTASFYTFYMNNYIVATHEDGSPTFTMGLAYDNGSGSFSNTLSDINPDDIAAGIGIDKLSTALPDSTVRFRVVFYNDHRSGMASALFVQNSTYSGVNGSAVVFAGEVVPEPATITMLVAAAAGILARRRKN